MPTSARCLIPHPRQSIITLVEVAVGGITVSDEIVAALDAAFAAGKPVSAEYQVNHSASLDVMAELDAAFPTQALTVHLLAG